MYLLYCVSLSNYVRVNLHTARSDTIFIQIYMNAHPGVSEGCQKIRSFFLQIKFFPSKNSLYYTPIRFKRDNLFHYLSLMKSSENKFYSLSAFYLIMWLMKASKNFEKKNVFENMRAGFHLRCQKSPRFFTPEIMP